jgi:hypothetical protein
MEAENEELPRPLLARNARRLDDKLLDIEAGAARFHDFVHTAGLRFEQGYRPSDPADGQGKHWRSPK